MFRSSLSTGWRVACVACTALAAAWLPVRFAAAQTKYWESSPYRIAVELGVDDPSGAINAEALADALRAYAGEGPLTTDDNAYFLPQDDDNLRMLKMLQALASPE